MDRFTIKNNKIILQEVPLPRKQNIHERNDNRKLALVQICFGFRFTLVQLSMLMCNYAKLQYLLRPIAQAFASSEVF